MYKQAEIEALIASIIPILKETNPFIQRKEKKIPDFHRTYELGIKYMKAIHTHAEVCEYPDELFEARAPNMDEREEKYMRENFKQTTLPIYMDYKSVRMRSFIDNNWYMEYKKDEQKYIDAGVSLQNYIEKEIRVFGSLENYVKNSLCHFRDIDGNGIVAVKPRRVTFNNGMEEVPLDDSMLYEPQPYYYRSDQVVLKEYDEYFLIQLDEKSTVSHGNSEHKKGYVFEFYDDDAIWQIRQVGKFVDYKFEYTVYFKHERGEIAAHELMGVPQLIENKVVWQPPFLFAVPLLDWALTNANYLQGCTANVMYPYRIILGSTCEYDYKDSIGSLSRCNHGQVYDSELGHTLECPSCKGFGLRNRISPLGDLIINPGSVLNQGEVGSVMSNAIKFVSPDSSSLQFVKDGIVDLEDRARNILHLKNTAAKNAAVTAEEIRKDQKAMDAFLRPISDQDFQLFEFLTDTIGWQRYKEDYKKVYFSYPNMFDQKTQADYIAEIEAAQKSQLPTVVIESLVYSFLQMLFYNEQETINIFRLIKETDRFLCLTNEDIYIKIQNGTAQKWESILHDSARFFIEELINEHIDDVSTEKSSVCVYPSVCRFETGLFVNPFEDQQAMLIQKAKDKAAEIAILPTKAQSTIDTILNTNPAAAPAVA